MAGSPMANPPPDGPEGPAGRALDHASSVPAGSARAGAGKATTGALAAFCAALRRRMPSRAALRRSSIRL